ncbi:MAG TPA: FAD-dependent oxidoreductase [Candidatus Paceibacterota bacterium]|nr:FAD-dependent oxidoreductase [Candidatus Paceibacterota bacterium]
MEDISTRCVVAGGGPAGIMLGYLLARSGVDVVVLEKWPDFFRDFRGDTIHPSTMQVLHELGLLEEFLQLPHSEMQQMAAHIGGQEIVMADFTRLKVRCPYIAFIPQWDFLNFLTAKAKSFPSFRIMMETEATDVLSENGKVTGVRAKNKDGEFTIKAELVVGADGRHSTVREKAQLLQKDLGAPIDVLWFRLSRKDDGTKKSLGYIDAGAGLVLLDRNDYWQCGYIIKKGGFADLEARGLESFKNDIANLAPFLTETVAELKEWDQVKLLSVAVDYLPVWYKAGLICIGDSAHAMSPVGGVGINLAVQDAVATANILIPAFKRGVPTVDDLAEVQARREMPARRIQKLQVFMHKRVFGAVINKTGHMQLPWFMQVMRRIPYLQKIPAYIIGIGFRPEHVEIK